MILKKKLEELKKKNLKRSSSSNYLLLILVYYFLILLFSIFYFDKKGFFLIIPLALFLVFYFSFYFSNKLFSKSELISSIVFLLVLGLGPFGIYDFSFFGVTGDVYIHLLAGYFVTRWLFNLLSSLKIRKARLITFILMIFFSIGVEVYEYLMIYLMNPADLNETYLLDTLNDFVNDIIGILLGLIRTKN